MTDPRTGAGYPQCLAPGIVVAGRVSTDPVNPRAGLLPVTFVPPSATWGQDSRRWGWDRACDVSDNDTREWLWLVSSQVFESYATGDPAVFPPPPTADAPTTGRSVMHLRIKAATAAGGRAFSIDLGQSIEFYASRLSVELVAPTGTVTLAERTGGGQLQRPSPQPGVLFTANVGVRLSMIEVSRALPFALFTQVRYLSPNQDHDILIPTAARRLTIYGEDLATPVMRWRRATLDMGVVDWDPLRPRLEIDVPSATTLRILAAPRDRVLTFVWTIVP